MASSNLTTSNNHWEDVVSQDINSIKIGDIIVLREHISQVIEITRAPIGTRVYFIVGKDIFTGRRYEDAISPGKTIQVPHVHKKDYLLVSIEDDGYVTLLDENTCETRADLNIKSNSELRRQLLEQYNQGHSQIQVTVIKAIDKEHITEFRIED